MKTALAQLASKVWDALKPPKPELGYYMPDEQSDAIRSWCTHVAACAVGNPNELDPSDLQREYDNHDTTTSAREAEGDTNGDGGGGRPKSEAKPRTKDTRKR